ncbi:hypothetical protein J6590_063589 [Homalodisca vitripennis]|nr:hypothetical protein J6590_063589 [Homalodisca vitripennis]
MRHQYYPRVEEVPQPRQQSTSVPVGVRLDLHGSTSPHRHVSNIARPLDKRFDSITGADIRRYPVISLRDRLRSSSPPHLKVLILLKHDNMFPCSEALPADGPGGGQSDMENDKSKIVVDRFFFIRIFGGGSCLSPLATPLSMLTKSKDEVFLELSCQMIHSHFCSIHKSGTTMAEHKGVPAALCRIVSNNRVPINKMAAARLNLSTLRSESGLNTIVVEMLS